MSRTLTVLSWNFEQNGRGIAEQRIAGHERLVSLNPDLVLRQEMWGAETNGNAVMYELESVLGLRGWLGPSAEVSGATGPATAVFASPQLFSPVREWPQTGPMWELPPTAVTLRYTPAGRSALPLIVLSYHLNYYSTTNRLAEAECLTRWTDKKWTRNGRPVSLPAILGGDNNSYPADDVEAAPALPVRERIQDRPHRLHRSHPRGDGRAMDCRPDAALREAGLVDAARYWATAPCGDTKAVARTVNACSTHGPDSRIDRIYLTPQLLPAVTGVDVVEVPEDVSDHHIVRLTLDGNVLADILNEQFKQAA